MDRDIVCLQIPSFEIVLTRTHEVSLRHRPVALAPTHTPRSLVLEVSQEAVDEGIQPGMPLELARQLCPRLRVIPPDSARTQAAHRELQQAIMPFAPVWESIRPGSLFLDLTGTQRLFGRPIEAPRSKLRGITELKHSELSEILARLPLSPHVLFHRLPVRPLAHRRHRVPVCPKFPAPQHPLDGRPPRKISQAVMLLNICTIRPGATFGCALQSRWIWFLSVPIASLSIGNRSAISAAVSWMIAVTASSSNALRYFTGNTIW